MVAFRFGVIVALASVIASKPLEASSIVYSNLASGTYICCTALAITGSSTVLGADWDQGSPFTPAADYTLDSISAALSWFEGTNAIDLWLMSDNGGVPGAIIESWSFTSLPEFGTTSTLLAVGTSLLNPLLIAGQQYWVIASAGAPDSFMDFNASSLSFGDAVYRIDGGAWTPDPNRPTAAFQVEGTSVGTPVPEPSTLLLLASGFASLSVRRWRRKTT